MNEDRVDKVIMTIYRILGGLLKLTVGAMILYWTFVFGARNYCVPVWFDIGSRPTYYAVMSWIVLVVAILSVIEITKKIERKEVDLFDTVINILILWTIVLLFNPFRPLSFIPSYSAIINDKSSGIISIVYLLCGCCLVWFGFRQLGELILRGKKDEKM